MASNNSGINMTDYINKGTEFLRNLTDIKSTSAKYKDPAENNSNSSTYSYRDFESIRTIGTGTFGNVLLVRYRKSNEYYALKILEKMKIVRLKQEIHTLNEKQILSIVNYPFIVNMRFSFKDNANLYMGMDYVNGGELFTRLKRVHRLNENDSRFYASQVYLAFEYLHNQSILYRDLKPENILLDDQGYIKITDFGFAKKVPLRTYTLCGTPEYLAPEILNNKGYGRSVDWWAFGILIYEMTTGSPPFVDDNIMEIYKKISNGKYKIPKFFSMNLKDLIDKLLYKDGNLRIGVLRNGSNDIRNHEWFERVNFDRLFHKQVIAPYIPNVHSPHDDSHFDKYEESDVAESPVDLHKDKFVEF